MRWLSFLFFIVVSLLFTQSLAYSAQEKALISLDFNEVTDGKTIISIVTQEKVSCSSFYIGGDTPRIIFDFVGSTYKLKNKVTLSETGLVRTARFGLHEDPLKTRMVVDLMVGSKKPQYTKDIQDGLIRIEITPYKEPVVLEYVAKTKVVADISKNDVVADETTGQNLVKPASVVKQVAENTVINTEKSAVKRVVQLSDTAKEMVVAEEQELDAETKVEAPVAETTEKLIFETFVPPPVEVEDAEGQENLLQESSLQQTMADATIPQVYLKDIKHSKLEGEEDVLAFFLTNFNTPTVTAVEEAKLLVVCAFSGVIVDAEMVREQIVDGNYVEKIKVSSDSTTKTVEVVLELKGDFLYDLEQTYYKNANVFALTVKGHPG